MVAEVERLRASERRASARASNAPFTHGGRVCALSHQTRYKMHPLSAHERL